MTRSFCILGRGGAAVVRAYGCTSNAPTSHIEPRGKPRWSVSTSHAASGITSMATLPGSNACV